MDSSTKAPLLRRFVFLYTCLGLRVSSLDARKWPSIVSFLWSLLLNSLVVYRFLLCDPFQIDSSLLKYTDKPLIRLLFNLNGKLNYGLSVTCLILFFHHQGARLVHLLDEPTFAPISPQKANRIAVTLFLLLTGFFTVTYLESLYNLNFNQWLDSSLNALALYLVFFYLMSPLLIAHYLTHSMYSSLHSLHQTIDSISIPRLIWQIGALSKCHQTLHRVFSLPLSIFLIYNTIDSVLCFSISSLQVEAPFLILFYALSIFAYTCYVVHLGVANQKLVQKIASSKMRLEERKYRKIFALQQMGNDEPFFEYKANFRLRELILFASNFQLKLFSIVSLDTTFMLLLAVFNFNYTVLIVQTR